MKKLWIIAGLAAALFAGVSQAGDDGSPFEADRRFMIRQIEDDARQTGFLTGRTAFSANVMKSMAAVPRHLFVPERSRDNAYENRPLPIGYGQTISQPYIVALMTDLLDVGKDEVVLEIGTGSGYQAAVLSPLARKVYTIEIIPQLGAAAKARLARLGYGNVSARVGDGYYGWEEAGPFDAIIVTAAASHIPPPLVDQLKPGGRMIIPVGSRFFTQRLTLVTRNAEGAVTTRTVLPVRFVPLTGKH